MARGGARKGAGRKPGSATKRTREIAERAAAEGVTPLEVMLQAMRKHYSADELDEAAAIAKDAAPYMHPRLSSVEVDLDDKRECVVSAEPMSEDEWAKSYGDHLASAAGTAEKPH